VSAVAAWSIDSPPIRQRPSDLYCTLRFSLTFCRHSYRRAIFNRDFQL
jgi:hypothetical protein